jgi:hypothetical protein
LIPFRSREILFIRSFEFSLGTSQSFFQQQTGVISSGIKQPAPETDYSLPPGT